MMFQAKKSTADARYLEHPRVDGKGPRQRMFVINSVTLKVRDEREFGK